MTIEDQGNNIVKLSGKISTNGTNNDVKSSYLYYTKNGLDPYHGTDYTSTVLLEPKDGYYEHPIHLNTSGTTTIRAVTYSYPTQNADSSLKSGIVESKGYFYSKPTPPKNLTITPLNDNYVEITADLGDDGSNNKAVGVTIHYYTNHKSTKQVYSQPF